MAETCGLWSKSKTGSEYQPKKERKQNDHILKRNQGKETQSIIPYSCMCTSLLVVSKRAQEHVQPVKWWFVLHARTILAVQMPPGGWIC